MLGKKVNRPTKFWGFPLNKKITNLGREKLRFPWEVWTWLVSHVDFGIKIIYWYWYTLYWWRLRNAWNSLLYMLGKFASTANTFLSGFTRNMVDLKRDIFWSRKKGRPYLAVRFIFRYIRIWVDKKDFFPYKIICYP